MENFSSVAGTPITVSHKGDSYEFFPLTVSDWGEIEQWMRKKVVEFSIRGLPDDLPPEDRKMFMSEAVKAGMEISLATSSQDNAERAARIQSMYNSVDGVVQILWLSLRKKVTKEKVMELLDDAENASLFEEVMGISGQKEGGSSKAEPKSG